jgi:hypothetical protein
MRKKEINNTLTQCVIEVSRSAIPNPRPPILANAFRHHAVATLTMNDLSLIYASSHDDSERLQITCSSSTTTKSLQKHSQAKEVHLVSENPNVLF